MQTATDQHQITQSLFNEFLEFKKLKEHGIAVADLTYPTLIDKIPDSAQNCQNNLSGESLPMAGKIRTDELCPKCNGKFQDTGKIFICPKHLTTPSRYYLDLHYKAPKKKGIRLKIRRDRSGKPLDSYARCQFEASRIALEIEEKKFNPNLYIKNQYKKYIIDNLIWRWYERIKPDLASSSRERREIMINKFHLPFFAGVDIRDIRKDDILEYWQDLKSKDLSENYTNSILRDFHKLLMDALDWELLEKIPRFPKIKNCKKLSPQWIDTETQEKILNNITPSHRPIFKFLMLTGSRPGEARALMWDCIDFEKRLITIRRTFSLHDLKQSTKTGAPRYLPMTDELYKLLKNQDQGLGYVFINSQTGNPYTKNIGTVWRKAAKKIEVNIPLKNCTRHSWGSQRLNEGFSYEEIAAVLGHDIKMTQDVYTEFEAQKLVPVMEGKKIVRIDRPKTVQKQKEV